MFYVRAYEKISVRAEISTRVPLGIHGLSCSGYRLIEDRTYPDPSISLRVNGHYRCGTVEEFLASPKSRRSGLSPRRSEHTASRRRVTSLPQSNVDAHCSSHIALRKWILRSDTKCISTQARTLSLPSPLMLYATCPALDIGQMA